MKITAALICAIVSVLFSILFDSWIRSRTGRGEDNARILAILRGRIRTFRTFQLLPLAVSVAAISAAAGFGMGWKSSLSCLAGAAAVIIPLFAGSRSFSNGITASYNESMNGDIRQALRSGFRSGSVLGALITGISLAVLCAFYITDSSGLMISFALGSAVAAAVMHTGGEVYSSAYALAVPSRDFTDRTGSYMAAGSDFAGSYILAAASAAALADLAVDTSGVTSTFTAESAVLFPLMVYGAGAVGSLAGIFMYRSGIGNDMTRGGGISCLAAGIITAAISFYLSIQLLQSAVYAWAVSAGIIAGLILSAVSRVFSSDSMFYASNSKTAKSLGRNTVVVFNLGTGMISTALYSVIIISAIGVSYMFANYYGVAMCAVGCCSVLGVFSAVNGMSSVTGIVSDIIASQKNTSENEALKTVSDSLYTVSARNVISGRTYATFSGALTSFAAFCAFFYLSGEETIDIMGLRVFSGIITGISAALILSGMLIGSVRITSKVALRDIGRNDDDTGATSAIRGAVIPAVVSAAVTVLIGFFAGVSTLAGFIIAVSATGCVLITAFNNSGIHFENSALQSLSSLIKMMVFISLAFIAVFMQVGGFLFRQ